MPRLRDRLSVALGRTPREVDHADYLTLKPAPQTIVDERTGHYLPGWYDSFAGVPNLKASCAPKRAFQTWYHIQIDHPERFIVLNLANIAVASNVAILLYDKKKRAFDNESMVRPFRPSLVTISDDLTRIEDKVTGSWMQRSADGSHVAFSLNTRDLACEGEAKTAIGPDLVQVTSFHNGRGSFQRYGNLELISGSLTTRGVKHDLEPGLLMAFDQTAGHQRGLQHWYWVCTSGFAKNERTGEIQPFGMQIAQDRERAIPKTFGCKYLLWLGGKLHKFAEAEFAYELLSTKTRDTGPWKVSMKRKDPALSAEIEMTPVAHRREKKSLILLDADFSQHYGELTGTIEIEGERYSLMPSFATIEDSRLEL